MSQQIRRELLVSSVLNRLIHSVHFKLSITPEDITEMEADLCPLFLPMEDLSGSRSGRARSPPPFQIYEDKNDDNEQGPETELQISNPVDLSNDPEADKENRPPANTSSCVALDNTKTAIFSTGEHNATASAVNPTHGHQLQNAIHHAETGRDPPAVLSANSTPDPARVASVTPSSDVSFWDARFLARSSSPCEEIVKRKGVSSGGSGMYLDDYDLEEYDIGVSELKELFNDDV